MARTDSGRKRTDARRRLRAEVPSTVALLADEHDFTIMSGYSTFPVGDHDVYLRQMEDLLRALSSQGVHTSVTLFDPDAFEEFCEEAGLEPDSATSRTRYTAASAGASVGYEGQPIHVLLPLLVDAAERQATLEYATTLLAGVGACADCGDDIGRAAYTRASQALMSLVEAVGSGVHHAVCSVPAEGVQLIAVLRSDRRPDGLVHLREAEALLFCTVLAVGIATGSPGGIVMRSSTGEGPDTLRGWSLSEGWPRPLTEAEVFTAYCTDADTGEPVPPEAGVDYRAGIPIAPPVEGTGQEG